MAEATVSHYRVGERLGSGGMGVVYRAEDTRLGRSVALKFLPPDLVRDEVARHRFVQEARAASALDHPNLCTIYDIDETPDGRLFIAMAHYTGETLSQRLGRGPLEPVEAMRIALGIARGLAHAHAHGIVHRDIKPSNVMLTADGEVKILDFGLAKLREESRGLTREGVVVGTVTYMAPEQARAQPADARTDLWALGVTLYEMVTGKPPFQAGSDQALLFAILQDEPPTLEIRGFTAGGEIERLLGELLAKDPARRPQTAQAVAERLERCLAEAGAPAAPVARRLPWRGLALAAGGVLAAVILATALLLPRAPQKAPLSSLAVLPFANLTGDPSRDYLGDGLAAALIQELGAVRGLNVVSRTDTHAYRDTKKSIKDIARELGVTGILEGQLLREGDRLRVQTTLTNPATGYIAWSESAVAAPDDVFAIESRLVQGLIEKLALAHPGQSAPRSAQAYDLYLKGLRQLDAVDEPQRGALAEALLRKALQLDPGFALAQAAMSEALVERYDLEHDRELLKRAEAAAREALRLAPEQPAGTVALAVALRRSGRAQEALEPLRRLASERPESDAVLAELARCAEELNDHAQAEAWFRRAVAARPGYWQNWNNLGAQLMKRGDLPAAREAFEKAASLAPSDVTWPLQNLGALAIYDGDFVAAIAAFQRVPQPLRDPYLANNLGWAFLNTGRTEEAERNFRLAIALSPGEPTWHANLATTLRREGRMEEARAEYLTAARLVREDPRFQNGPRDLRIQYALYLARSGDCSRARRELDKAPANGAPAGIELYNTARIHAACGERAAALDALRAAVGLGYPPGAALQDDEFQPLRSDPTFQSLTATLKR